MIKIKELRGWDIFRASNADDERMNDGYQLAAYPRGVKRDGNTVFKADTVRDIIVGISEHERLGFNGCVLGG